jgi:signal transduction histidine kinase
MSPREDRRGFLKRISKNIQHIDKQTLLDRLLQEAESHDSFLKLLHSLEEGILIVSPDGEIEAINDSAKKMLGITEDAGKPFWLELADQDLKVFFENHLPGLTAQTVQTLRVLNPHEQSLKIHLHPHILSKPARHLIELIDLTHSLIPEVERLARTRFDALLRLAGGLAHEIGNPLNAISLHVEILKKQLHQLQDAQREPLHETVQIIRSEITRLDRIVRNFLKSTRRAPLRFQMLNFADLFNEVIRVMRPTLEEREIHLEVQMPRRIEFFLDEERMRSMLINLIQNAMEAMPQGGNLKIATELQGQAVQIRIEDTGKGITKENLPHIFDAYFTTKENGSGLGLMFVHDAVADHGGKIYVKSKPRKGTRFEILLPLRRSNLQISDATGKAAEGSIHA